MELVLVDDMLTDERLSREFRALDYMERTINACNKAIRDLIDPIAHNKGRVSVHKNYDDYRNLEVLNKLLDSNSTRTMFKEIQADLHKNLPSNLAGIPMSEVRDLLESDLQSDTIYDLIDNIENLLSKRNLAKNDKEGSHLINFIVY